MPAAPHAKLPDSRSLGRHLRPLLAALLLGAATVVPILAALAVAGVGGHPWYSGDWLINYGGGFVRRGLGGELLLALGGDTEGTLLALVGVQALCTLLLALFVLGFLRRQRCSWSALAIALGPAGLPFVVYDLPGALRKELLLLAVLALLGAALRRRVRARSLAWSLTAAALGLYGIALLSWEPSALLLPLVLYLLLARPDGTLPPLRARPRLFGAAALAFAAISAFGLSALNPGNPTVAGAVCARLQATGFDPALLCSGAIDVLGHGAGDEWALLLAHFPLYLAYLPLALLAAAPLWRSGWIRAHLRLVALTLLAACPLLLGADYGRWIYLLTSALSIALMASAGEASGGEASGGEASGGEASGGEASGDALGRWRALDALPFLLCWGIPYFAWVPYLPSALNSLSGLTLAGDPLAIGLFLCTALLVVAVPWLGRSGRAAGARR